MTTLQEVMDTLAKCGGVKSEAARELGIPISTFKDKVKQAERKGIKAQALTPVEENALERTKLMYEERIKSLEKRLKAAQQEQITGDRIKELCFQLPSSPPSIPAWTLPPPGNKTKNIPVLQCTDWQYGEVIESDMVRGYNKYDMDIADARIRKCTEKTIDICFNHLTDNEYDGIVLIYNGDMVSGDIHDELTLTNEKPVMPVVLRLFEQCVAQINTFEKKFKKIWFVGDYGNHGRTTRKPYAKNANFLNWDWFLYNMLERHYTMLGNKNIIFNIPNGYDALINVYKTRLLVTHGDRLGSQGGDSIIGSVGPIIRGEKRTRAAEAAWKNYFDVLVIGHYHERHISDRVIAGNSLCGYNEYAMSKRFDPAPPTQELFFVNDKLGVVSNWKIFVDEA